MSNIKKNISYNLIYRIIVILIPLITSPYISRVLGPTKVGVFSYTNSIAYYFFLLSMLGVNNYGNREIAKTRSDKEKLSETFWQIYYMQLFLSIIMSCLYIIGVLKFGTKYLEIALLQVLYVISAATDINWFAFGLEQFKVTTIRSSVLKIATAVCFFLFVKTKNDLWIYTFILQFGNILSLLVIWPLVKKNTTFQKPNFKIIITHIKPNLILFLPFIASSLYQYMDRIMIGSFTEKDEVGYYNYAENILSIPMQLTTAVGTVMLPHISNLIASDNKKKSIEILNLFLKYITWINIGLAFGMAAVAKIFIPWFLGAEYKRTAELLIVLTPVIVINGIADVLRTQYLIPNEKDKLYTISICSGAGLNVIVNFVLIPYFFGVGASIATIAAYFLQLFIQIIKTWKEVNYKSLLKNCIPFIIIGIIMLISVRAISIISFGSVFISLIVQVVLGGILYVVMTVLWMIFIQKDSKICNFFVKNKYMKS